jgi:hypothetical protein
MSNSNSIPPSGAPMPEGSGDNHADDEAAKEYGQHPQKNPLPALTNEIVEGRLIPWLPKAVSRTIEVGLTSIFWILGSDFQVHGPICVGYVFNCLAIICFLLLMAEAAFAQWPNRKKVLVGFGLACVVLVGIYSIFCFTECSRRGPEPPKPAFSIAITTEIWNPSTDLNREGFWFVHRFGTNLVKSPVHLLVYVYLTNLKETPLEVSSYSVEIEKSDHSGWITCSSIDVRDGVFFQRMNAEFKQAAKLVFDTNNLASALESPVAHHHTVHGWAFFDNALGFGMNKKRFRIRDMTGEEYTHDIVQGTNKSLDITVQRVETWQYGGSIDIDAYPIMDYTNSIH